MWAIHGSLQITIKSLEVRWIFRHHEILRIESFFTDLYNKCSYLNNVVDDEGILKLVGFSVSHELRSPDFDDVEVGWTEEQSRKRAWHQGPVVYPDIPAIPDGLK